MLIWLVITVLLLYKYQDFKQLKNYIIVYLSSFIINDLFIKNIVKRDRPFISNPDIIPLVNETSYSFPSGHAASSFVAATFLSLHYPKYRIPLFVLAFLIAVSRVYVGVHYPTDVIAGACLGIAVGYFFYKIFKK